MKIKDIILKNNLALAPMAGYTDVGFREICALSGAGLTVTEMVSAKGLMYESEKTKNLLLKSTNENIVSAQIFGNDPIIMGEIVNHQTLEKFDIIDINMGCPATKIVKNKEGSFLLNDPILAGKIVESCAKNTNKPISVKIRTGFQNDKIVAVDFAKRLADSGASMIAVHGRTKEQGYSGDIDYKTIEQVKNSVNIPVYGNGNVTDIESYKRMLQTGVDGVMIGRGTLGNPFIFSEILNIEKPTFNPALKHIELLENIVQERTLVFELRKSLIHYFPKNERIQLMKIDNLIDLKKFIKDNLKNNL